MKEVVISLLGVIFSGMISWFIARTTANKEIEKIKLTWTREDSIDSDQEFSDMAQTVSKFLLMPSENTRNIACLQVAQIRFKARGRLAQIIDALYNAIESCLPDEWGDISVDTSKIKTLLDDAVDEKRKEQRRYEQY
jgi:hypothetical protein